MLQAINRPLFTVKKQLTSTLYPKMPHSVNQIFNKNSLSSNFSRSWIIPLLGKKSAKGVSQLTRNADEISEWHRSFNSLYACHQGPRALLVASLSRAQAAPGHESPALYTNETAPHCSGLSSCLPPAGHSIRTARNPKPRCTSGFPIW